MDRRTPIDELERLFERVERQLDEAAPQIEGLPGGGSTAGGAPLDVMDRGEEFAVTVELPGYDPEDVDVRIADRTLFVDAHRDEEMGMEEADFVRRERSHRSVSRSVRLPEPPNVDEVTANMEGGVLRITVPKAAPDAVGESIDIE